jgi:predicted AAA+ superfamily ATPase
MLEARVIAMEPWYKVAQPRAEVREGRSLNPNEFAIALEQVASGRGPEDYRDPGRFFARTYFTRALREHSAMVLRRLAGEPSNTAPVLTLITQFGGGKTHTLTALYHLVKTGSPASSFEGVERLAREAGLTTIPDDRVAVFVGKTWDPHDGLDTPWQDLAHQLAGAEGVRLLGSSAKTTPPGTDARARLFEAAGGRVLVLCDEVLNFMNRHRAMA